ncbi:hypothetical protein [Marinimicrobium alkaliphilum]|uniref:hypothetical protein n=1 Tax=Marinimicrobium alkaliphilum TaxID=2202654 RepID=UPI000DB9A986|nr:hypothetical protein [Marinimicrobium alkaliphilum]
MKSLNPIKRILNSDATRGLKIIALGLVVLLASAAPYMLYMLVAPADANPVGLAWIFVVGALIAHFAFIVGLLLLMYDVYFNKNNK